MNRGGPTPLGIIIFVVLVILLIIGGFFLFTGGGSTPAEIERRPQVAEALAERSVRMTVYGKIVAEEERESYQVTISPSTRIVELRKGYSNRVAESRDFRNSMSAYEEFVYALEKLDYDKRNNVPEGRDDDRGTCATGKRYVFEILEFGDVVENSWTTTCRGSKGTFGGDYKRVERLYQAQIPELRAVGGSVEFR